MDTLSNTHLGWLGGNCRSNTSTLSNLVDFVGIVHCGCRLLLSQSHDWYHDTVCCTNIGRTCVLVVTRCESIQQYYSYPTNNTTRNKKDNSDCGKSLDGRRRYM